jgi:hypothetical protein
MRAGRKAHAGAGGSRLQSDVHAAVKAPSTLHWHTLTQGHIEADTLAHTCSWATWAMAMPQPQPAAADTNAENAGKSDSYNAIHGFNAASMSPPPNGATE